VASTDAHPWPKKNQACRITFDLRLTTGALNTGGTGLDSEISKDGGTFTDCTNEATQIATTSGVYYLDLTSTEMNADTVAIKVKSTDTNNMDQVLVLYPQDIPEPSGAPTWPMDIEEVLGWLGALARNKMLQTATTTTLRNDADNATISTSTVSDDATTYTRGEYT
jgi:hypothetical protein